MYLPHAMKQASYIGQLTGLKPRAIAERGSAAKKQSNISFSKRQKSASSTASTSVSPPLCFSSLSSAYNASTAEVSALNLKNFLLLYKLLANSY